MTKTLLDGERIFQINDFLSAAECAEMIDRFRGHTFEKGTILDHRIDHFRNNDRVIHDNPSLAATIYEKAKPWLPAELDGRVGVGFNERWRYYRYLPGQFFKMHRDGEHHRFREREKSILTFMIYLSDVSRGGETKFYKNFGDDQPYLSVVPKTGSALVFLHEIWHEGAEVIEGEKHVLRTDVMFRSKSLAERPSH